MDYDAKNQLVKVCVDTSSNAVCDACETVIAAFIYDGDGKRVKPTITETTNSGQKQCFQYDALDRLIKATTYTDTAQGCTAQLGVGNYDESYGYNAVSGNLASKAGINYTAYDASHPHAVKTLSNGNSYTYDANGNQITRVVGGQTFTLGYDAENRLVSVSGAVTASFVYDGDGNRVKSTLSGTTTTFVGSWYEVTGSQVTKYYYAGTQRVAMRKYTIPSSMVVEYFLGDHLGSTSITTDNTGAKVSEMRYKPCPLPYTTGMLREGEVRSWWTASLSTTPVYKLALLTCP